MGEVKKIKTQAQIEATKRMEKVLDKTDWSEVSEKKELKPWLRAVKRLFS
jgi:acetyl-CoA carboxylase beta subunit